MSNIGLKRDLSAGDVIIDTKPVVHIVYNESKHKYCDNCLKNSGLKKCSNCRQMSYCGKKCQRIDWKYHRNECKVLANKKFKPFENIWSERLLIRLWLTIKSDETFAAKRYQLFNGSDISLNDIEVNVKELYEDIDRLVEFELICNHFNDYELDYNRKELFHWFGLITTSAIRQEFVSYSSYSGGILYFIPFSGIGLYPELFAVRHSCLPNAGVVTNGLSLQLRANKGIAVGTEITRNYAEVMRNKTERQKLLSKEFLINHCNCVKCEHNLDKHIDYDFILSVCQNQIQRQLLIAVTANPLIECRHLFDEIIAEMRKTIDCCKEAMGAYSPYITPFLITEILFLIRFATLTDGEVEPLNYLKLEEHIRITYGVNHPIYYKNIKIENVFIQEF